MSLLAVALVVVVVVGLVVVVLVVEGAGGIDQGKGYKPCGTIHENGFHGCHKFFRFWKVMSAVMAVGGVTKKGTFRGAGGRGARRDTNMIDETTSTSSCTPTTSSAAAGQGGKGERMMLLLRLAHTQHSPPDSSSSSSSRRHG